MSLQIIKTLLNITDSHIILLVNGSLSLIFVSLDKRNRVLYRTCQKVGGNIEELLLSKDFNEKSAELFDVSKKDLFANILQIRYIRSS